MLLNITQHWSNQHFSPSLNLTQYYSTFSLNCSKFLTWLNLTWLNMTQHDSIFAELSLWPLDVQTGSEDLRPAAAERHSPRGQYPRPQEQEDQDHPHQGGPRVLLPRAAAVKVSIIIDTKDLVEKKNHIHSAEVSLDINDITHFLRLITKITISRVSVLKISSRLGLRSG